MAQAFFVVGCRDWGKSDTLKELKLALNGNRRSHKAVKIGKGLFSIWEMSQDDILGRWTAVLDRLNRDLTPHAILTVCPKDNAVAPLRALRRRGFELFFWVIRERCDGKPGRIETHEIAKFREIGTVAFCRQPADRSQRADQLKRFIGHNIR